VLRGLAAGIPSEGVYTAWCAKTIDKEALIYSELPCGTGMCRHFSNTQVFEK
jgi:hypothetical protein